MQRVALTIARPRSLQFFEIGGSIEVQILRPDCRCAHAVIRSYQQKNVHTCRQCNGSAEAPRVLTSVWRRPQLGMSRFVNPLVLNR
jgi:hypothetical protein